MSGFRALDALRAVRALHGLNLVDAAVLNALILRCDDDGTCFPSRDRIAADARVHVRTVAAQLKRLAAAGHITIEARTIEGRSTTSLYRVLLAGVNKDHPGVADDHPTVAHDPPGVAQDHVEGDPRSPTRVADDHGEGGGRSHRSAHEICPVGTAHVSPASLTLGESSPKKAKKGDHRKPETAAPASDATPEAVEAWCRQWGIPSPSSDVEAAKFLDDSRAKDRRYRDWGAAWRNWKRRAPLFAPKLVTGGRRYDEPAYSPPPRTQRPKMTEADLVAAGRIGSTLQPPKPAPTAPASEVQVAPPKPKPPELTPEEFEARRLAQLEAVRSLQ